MNKPKVTVITVCYNCKADIENTILSVVNQTYPNIEGLLILSKSTSIAYLVLSVSQTMVYMML